MGCGSTKEAILPPLGVDDYTRRQQERIAREDRARKERDYFKKRDAARKIADATRQIAMGEITSRLGTLESYWTAGEFEADNLKPHFIPALGPMSLSEKVPPAPSVLKGVILFAGSSNGKEPAVAAASALLQGVPRPTMIGQSPAATPTAHANILRSASTPLPVRSKPLASPTSSSSLPSAAALAMPLPRHIRPMFIDNAILAMLSRNRREMEAAVGGGASTGTKQGRDASFGTPNGTEGDTTTVAVANGGNNAAAAIAPVEGHHTPRRRASASSGMAPAETPIGTVSGGAAGVHSLNVTLLSNYNGATPRSVAASQLTPLYLQQQAHRRPNLSQQCFVYPHQPFVGRAYLEGPMGNRAAGWVRLPCGPVTRKRTTRNRPPPAADGDANKGEGDEESSPSPNGPPKKRANGAANNNNTINDKADDNNDQNNNAAPEQQGGAYYFAPEVRGYLNAQKPCYDVKEDGPVDEPVGSHAYEVGVEDDEEDERRHLETYLAALAEAEKAVAEAEKKAAAEAAARNPLQAPNAADGKDGQQLPEVAAPLPPPPPPAAEEHPNPVALVQVPAVAVRQIVPRRLEKYFIYPKELTALGLQLEYRHVPDVRTLGEAKAILGLVPPSSSNGGGAEGAEGAIRKVPLPLAPPSAARSAPSSCPLRGGLATSLADVMAAVAKHMMPSVYSAVPQSAGLASFYQCANTYFGEDKPDGLAVKIYRGDSALPQKRSAAGARTGSRPSSPPMAAGGGAAAINTLHSINGDKPLERCFLTFLSPNATSSGNPIAASVPAVGIGGPSPYSVLFSPHFMAEENSIPLHLFGDFGGMLGCDLSPAALPAGGGSPVLGGCGWWAAAHALAESVAMTSELSLELKQSSAKVADRISRSEAADPAMVERIAMIPKALEALKVQQDTAKATLKAMHAQNGLVATEDEVFWLHFRKELCGFMARVLEENVEGACPTPKAKLSPIASERGAASLLQQQQQKEQRQGDDEPPAAVSAPPADATPPPTTADPAEQSYVLATSPIRAPAAVPAAMEGVEVEDDPLVDGPPTVSGAPAEPPNAGGPSLRPLLPLGKAKSALPPLHPSTSSAVVSGDDAPVTALQFRLHVHGQYNNTTFIAFNGHGRNNTAEAEDGGGAYYPPPPADDPSSSSLPPQFRTIPSAPSSPVPQWMSFTDSTRRPRAKGFAKPLASGVVTAVLPHRVPLFSDGALAGSVDTVTHLRYVAGVIGLVLDEFTGSVIVA